MKIKGIYKIINKINDTYYVGSSIDIFERWYSHKKLLNNNKHYNKHLQNAWNKYGEISFEFKIIEEQGSKQVDLLELEQKYLNIAKSESTYNLTFIAGGGNHGNEINKKISKSLKKYYKYNGGNWCNKKHTQQTIEKMKINHVGFSGKHHSIESKIKMSLNNPKPNLGKRLSESTKEKIRKKRKNIPLSDSHKMAIKNSALRGINNKNYNPEIIKFKNKYTNELFEGTRNEFYSKYNLHKGNVSLLVLGKVNEVKGWKLN